MNTSFEDKEIKKNYDVAIIGAGAAGLFCAARLALSGLKVGVFDSGGRLPEYLCKRFLKQVDSPNLIEPHCRSQFCLTGFGGAALHFEANLDNNPFFYQPETKEPAFSKNLIELFESTSLVEKYAKKVFNKLRDYGLVYTQRENGEGDLEPSCQQKTLPVNMTQILEVLGALQVELDSSGVEFNAFHCFEDLREKDGRFEIDFSGAKYSALQEKEQIKYTAHQVIFALGKRSFKDILKVCDDFGISYFSSPYVDIGFRIEIPRSLLTRFLEKDINPRMENQVNGSICRTFCVCDGGKMMKYYMSRENKYFMLDGQHAHTNKGNHTNFSILTRIHPSVGQTSLSLAESFAADTNNLCLGFVPGQIYSDFLQSRESTNAQIAAINPSMQGISGANLADVARKYGIQINWFFDWLGTEHSHEFIAANSLLIAPSIEKYHPRIKMDASLKTSKSNLFFIGDCSGNVTGIVSAAITGERVADTILEAQV